MKQTIYVRLLNKEIETWRPVEAEETGVEGVFVILSPNTQSHEKWEFSTGSRVQTDGLKIEGEFRTIAVAQDPLKDSSGELADGKASKKKIPLGHLILALIILALVVGQTYQFHTTDCIQYKTREMRICGVHAEITLYLLLALELSYLISILRKIIDWFFEE